MSKSYTETRVINYHTFTIGYDDICDYTFMMIEDEVGEMIYCNLDDKAIDPFSMKNFDYFIYKAKVLTGIDITDFVRERTLYNYNTKKEITMVRVEKALLRMLLETAVESDYMYIGRDVIIEAGISEKELAVVEKKVYAEEKKSKIMTRDNYILRT